MIECTGLALSATETTGLRCRITSSDAADTEVPAQYDAERQAVTCIAPQVWFGAALNMCPRTMQICMGCRVQTGISVHALTLPVAPIQGVLQPQCCVLSGQVGQGHLLGGSAAASSQAHPDHVDDGKSCWE